MASLLTIHNLAMAEIPLQMEESMKESLLKINQMAKEN